MNMRSFAIFVGLWMAVASLAVAQRTVSTERSLEESGDRKVGQPLVFNPMPLDAPLDPTSYRVGGGDQFAIQISSIPSVMFTLTVGIDGTLLIPSVGELRMRGLTLQEAQGQIKRLVAERYLRTQVSVSLAMARRITVYVKNSFGVSQIHEGIASDRVSTVLFKTEPQARRSILLRRSDGRQQRVDLDRFAATGDPRWNPHVAEGDEIVVNSFEGNVQTVAIGGDVWLPGEFELIEGDRVGDLVQFARGLRVGARRDSVVLARFGEAPQILDISGNDSLLRLNAGDRLWVPTARKILRAQMISVSGEVTFPGMYPLNEGATRLSDILAIAGGMTKDALVTGATLHRGRVPESRVSEDLLLSMRGNPDPEDTVYIRQEEELRLFGERVNVDFGRAVANPGSNDDPFVKFGDRVLVPRSTGSVYMFGQVVSPGHVQFLPGKKIDAYIDAAGGFTDHAKAGDVVIIKRASRQWLEPDQTEIEDGDAVWVPKVIERDFATEFMPYAQIVGVFSAVATIILVFTQLSK